MILTLTIENFDSLQDGGPTTITLRGQGASVGRRGANDWVLPDPDRHISGHHFDVSFHAGAYYLTDVSTNGTFLRGQTYRLDGPHRIADGERFTVGHYVIAARLMPEATTAPVGHPAAAPRPPVAAAPVEAAAAPYPQEAPPSSFAPAPPAPASAMPPAAPPPMAQPLAVPPAQPAAPVSAPAFGQDDEAPDDPWDVFGSALETPGLQRPPSGLPGSAPQPQVPPAPSGGEGVRQAPSFAPGAQVRGLTQAPELAPPVDLPMPALGLLALGLLGAARLRKP